MQTDKSKELPAAVTLFRVFVCQKANVRFRYLLLFDVFTATWQNNFVQHTACENELPLFEDLQTGAKLVTC